MMSQDSEGLRTNITLLLEYVHKKSFYGRNRVLFWLLLNFFSLDLWTCCSVSSTLGERTSLRLGRSRVWYRCIVVLLV